MNTKIIRILTLVAYMAMVVVNFLAMYLPLGGKSTGEVSDSYPNLFAPAGYAFSIWGLIYLLLAIYVIYQLKRGNDVLLGKVNRIFILNALLNAAWIFAWHNDIIWLSVILIIGLLISLITIADILRKSTLTERERRLVCLPFSVYFGWITVATIANITVFLVSLGWGGFGLADSFWTVAALLVGALIGSWRMLKDRFIPYGLVFVWAYGAILYKHVSASGFAGQHPSVIVAAVLCIIAFIGMILYISSKKKAR